ncbi:MAG: SurA N-terminal domain-containing protein [Patescibacteria group bacterium]
MSENTENISNTQPSSPSPTFLSSVIGIIKNNSRLIFVVLVVSLIGMLVYRFKGQVVVATVNGKPIFRWELVNQLEKQSGSTALDNMITEKLVAQEARKEGLSVDSQEVGEEISTIEEQLSSQGQSLGQLLELQGMTRSDLREQVTIQMLVEKLVEDEVEVSEQELRDYFEENKDSLGEDADFDTVKEDLRENLRQQKISEKIQEKLQALRDQASINHWLFQQ